MTAGTVIFNAGCGGDASSTAPVTPAPSSIPTAATLSGVPDLGAGASLNGRLPFPPDNVWNQPVDTAPVDPNSNTYINSVGRDVGLHADFGTNNSGIPYVVVGGNTPPTPISFTGSSPSDPGPYPVPAGAPIEHGADRHVIVIDRDHWTLYELFDTMAVGNGYVANYGAVFDLSSDALRPAGLPSADGAGLPIFPGLARFDEVVQQGAINHALRFTVRNTQDAYVFPARHCDGVGADTSLPPLGMRVRLKAGFDVSPFPASARVILTALKKYGMILADRGSNWFISGAPDDRWNDQDLAALGQVTGNDLEVVNTGSLTDCGSAS